MNIQEQVSLKDYTTLKIGGLARYFSEVTSEDELKKTIEFAQEHNVPYLVISGGSNLLVSDQGFDGVVIKVKMQGIRKVSKKVRVKAGTPLQELVDFANENGYAGAEKLTGIPGTVGGALYGNAGAYGQTISDKVVRVRVLENGQIKWMDRKECNFGYRESGFKGQMNIIILEAEFKFDEAKKDVLIQTSDEILNRRLKKYPHGILCPGSFFKNLLKEQLPEKYQEVIPADYYGKMPAGYFLDIAGAKGDCEGDIEIAPYHANLFINRGNGTAADFFRLAKKWKQSVKEKFGVELEPEVQLIGFKEDL